ncbi:MAG: 2-oxo acid dehydrogenase subunit E2 [Leptospiraceae bacterium]|nr:2-oxo acid dehydrogenase subunit E2 [Leptospiraceae bacterium]
MAKLIELTQLSPTMSEGSFVRWTINKGDSVDPGDVVAEVETDKAVMEMEALDSGILLATLAEEGDKLPVGAPLGILGEMGEEISDLLEQAKKKLKEARQKGDQESSDTGESSENENQTSSTEPASDESRDGTSQKAEQDSSGQRKDGSKAGQEDEASKEESGGSSAGTSRQKTTTRASANVRVSSPEKPVLDAPAQNGLIALPAHRILYKKSKAGVRATPLARKIAREKGVDLSLIEPTGRGGSITEEDVNRFQKTAASTGPGIEARPDRKVELSNMRKVIASRLHDAKNNIPHFYLTVEYHADAILNLRKSLNRDLESTTREGEEAHRFSLNDLITRAVALSLARHPVVNSSWRENHVLEHGRIDIGVAVAVEGGLITPYVRHADQISLMQLSKKTADLVSRARSRKLKPEEFTNGTFTISNLGMFGIKEFSAIINEPEAALLAVGGIEEKPAARDGQIIVEKTITMTLSCDHRVVDGAEGARFLQTLKGFIENPHTLIVGS